MEPTSHNFKANAHRALGDANLQRAMTMMRTGFPEKRAQAIAMGGVVSVISASTSATWRTATGLPSRVSLPASEEAAHIAAEQRLGAVAAMSAALSETILSEISEFDAERAAEAATDFRGRHLFERQSGNALQQAP